MDFAGMLEQARTQAVRERAAAAAAAAAGPAGNAELSMAQRDLAALEQAWAGAAPFGPEVLAAARVGAAPRSVDYFPGFVDPQEAERLARLVQLEPFQQLDGRQLQNHGGVPHLSGTILEPLPSHLDALAALLVRRGVVELKPDQALVNRYKPGEGTILSLQSPAVMEFYQPQTDAVVARVILEPNSLLVFSEDAFTELKHSIAPGPAHSLEAPIPCANAHLVADTALQQTDRVSRLQQRISVTLRSVAIVARRINRATEIVDRDTLEEMDRRERMWRNAISTS